MQHRTRSVPFKRPGELSGCRRQRCHPEHFGGVSWPGIHVAAAVAPAYSPHGSSRLTLQSATATIDLSQEGHERAEAVHFHDQDTPGALGGVEPHRHCEMRQRERRLTKRCIGQPPSVGARGAHRDLAPGPSLRSRSHVRRFVRAVLHPSSLPERSLGWQGSLAMLARVVEPEIPDRASPNAQQALGSSVLPVP